MGRVLPVRTSRGVVVKLAAATLALVLACQLDEPFDRERWLAASGADIPSRDLRGRMADDLVDNVLRPGMTRSEVLPLLGEPQQTSYGRGDALVYHLGDGSPSPVAAFLNLDFEGDTLTSFHVARD